MYRDLPDLGVDVIGEPLQVSHDPANQQLFEPVREPVGEKIHNPSLEQTRQQGDQRGAQKDNAASGHELLHALAFGARIIRSVALQQIHHAPHAKTSAEGNNEGLQSIDRGRKKLHRASISPGIFPASSPQTSYHSFPRKREKSFIPLRFLFPQNL
ncbi:hypothetical protein QKU_1448 [Clostridioides difficile DA00203]|nr:hypothetical protein QKU_1448 [Clostridioides difficile DA00203]